MADSTINELNLIDSVDNYDSIPIFDVSDTSTTPTKKGTFSKILDWLSSKTLSSLNTSSTLPINSTAVTTVTDKKQNAFSELASKTDFANSDLVIVRSGSTDYKGTLGDLLKTAVSQINATTVNATTVNQNNNSVLDTSNVISELDTSSSNPINSSAVNNALAEYPKLLRLGSGSGETSISYKDLNEGVYLIFGTYLYSQWEQYYMGIFCNYIGGGKYTTKLTKISADNVYVNLDQENQTFNSSAQNSAFYAIQLGYW